MDQDPQHDPAATGMPPTNLRYTHERDRFYAVTLPVVEAVLKDPQALVRNPSVLEDFTDADLAKLADAAQAVTWAAAREKATREESQPDEFTWRPQTTHVVQVFGLAGQGDHRGSLDVEGYRNQADYTPPKCPTCGAKPRVDWLQFKDGDDSWWIPATLTCPVDPHHTDTLTEVDR